nr:MAG TPA: hypothetical protein [Caudoviricetes sp.]
MVNSMHLVSKAYCTRTLNRKEVYSSVQRKAQSRSFCSSFYYWFHSHYRWYAG